MKRFAFVPILAIGMLLMAAASAAAFQPGHVGDERQPEYAVLAE